MLSEQSAGELFTCVLQHLKCIEVRLEYAKATTSQKQKFALGNAAKKVSVAINHLCDLLPSSDAVLEVKKELDKANLVYVMLLTEQLSRLSDDDLEDVIQIIETHINNKYKQ
jgi:hypothetical protein